MNYETHPNCPICEQSTIDVIFKKNADDIAECKSCKTTIPLREWLAYSKRVHEKLSWGYQ